DQTVTIYPNPALAGKDIVVAMNQIPADLVLQVYDANGALVEAQTKANQSGTQMMIDTQNLAAGTYYINLSTAGNSVSMKVQVVK
ncbi:MAG: T9SS type A sorting domain-containing protein, partial [Flavobacteriales bacterium]